MRQENNGQEEYKVGKGLAAGLIGGLAASFAMNQFQTLWNQLSQAEPSNEQSGQQEISGKTEHDRSRQQARNKSRRPSKRLRSLPRVSSIIT